MSKYVKIGGVVSLYKAKAPFEASGESIKGAIEYDKDTDALRCHECGKWFKGLSTHINVAHGMTAREYKIRHGLKKKTALISDEIRLKHSQRAAKTSRTHGSHLQSASVRMAAMRSLRHTLATKKVTRDYSETLNARNNCDARLLDKIKTISHSVGRTPTAQDLQEHGVHPEALKYRFGTLGAATRMAGLAPNAAHGKKWYSDSQLLSILNSYIRHRGKKPAHSDFARHDLPSKATYIRRFDTWRSALRQAEQMSA